MWLLRPAEPGLQASSPAALSFDLLVCSHSAPGVPVLLRQGRREGVVDGRPAEVFGIGRQVNLWNA